MIIRLYSDMQKVSKHILLSNTSIQTYSYMKLFAYIEAFSGKQKLQFNC